MDKKYKDAFFIVMILLASVVILGDDGSDSNVDESIFDVLADPNDEFSRQLVTEIDDTSAGTWADITSLKYDDKTKVLRIDASRETAWDTERLRNYLMYFTFETMPVVVAHADKIDSVTITGYANMLDMQGNSELTMVYQVQTDTTNAKNVNWENLKGIDMLQALEYNFDTVFWHPGIMV